MTTTETYTCPHHNREVPMGVSCSECVDAFNARRKPEEMMADEREAEMRRLRIVTYPFSDMHQRIEELVGRPVWTHEMGGLNWERLCKEARWETRPASMEEIIGLVPAEKLIIVQGATPND